MPPVREQSPQTPLECTMETNASLGKHSASGFPGDIVRFQDVASHMTNGTVHQITPRNDCPNRSSLCKTVHIIDNSQKQCAKYGKPLPQLQFDALPFAPDIARVRITGSTSRRWQIPESVLPIENSTTPVDLKDCKYDLLIDDDKTCLGFAICRKDEDVPVFDSRGLDFAFHDQYIELSTRLPPQTHVYGLGEVTGDFKREPGLRYAFWARDAQTPVGENAYSSVPFFTGMSGGKAFGVYLHSSNALDMIYTPDKITYKIVGGVIDLFIFIGPSYEDVVCQFQRVVGKPQMPPYWSLGYHQCRWGYDTIEKLEISRKQHAKLNLPVDTWWLDIDYMESYRLFTLDESRYPDFATYVDQVIHGANQRLVAVVDPGVKCNIENYKPYTDGKELDIFIKNGNSARDFIGKVWPGHVTFPDWFHPRTQKYWTDHHREWFKKMPIDGVWHDMNECSNFLNGDVFEQNDPEAEEDCILIPTDEETVEQMAEWSAEGDDAEAGKRGPGKPKPKDAFDPSLPTSITNPPYTVNHGGCNWPLSARSISVESTHHGGITEYDAHNLFGLQNCIATYNTLLELKPDQRPFILTRSIFASAGKYASKWLGDNWSTWESMRYSISGMFNMQMFGVPHVGADIGGFNGVPSKELLIRWFQLGSMYPFCRNHNLPNTPCQEAYITTAIAANARQYLDLRYRLLPFWNTAFAKVSNHGGSVVQPVWSVYSPQDNASRVLTDSNNTFLINNSLLVVPVLEEGATSVDAWIPAGGWFDFNTGIPVGGIQDKWLSLDAPLEHMPILVRSSTIIPFHHQSQENQITSADYRKAGLHLYISLDTCYSATGEVYLDDGISFSSGKSWISFRVRGDPFASRLALDISGVFGYVPKADAVDEILIRSISVVGLSPETLIFQVQTSIELSSAKSVTIDL